MTITQKLLSVAVIAMLSGLTACDNDDDNGNSALPKDDAKKAITTFNAEATDDLQDLANADGLEAVQDFFELVNTDDPFGKVSTDKKTLKTFFHRKGAEFKKAFVPTRALTGRAADDGAFDFDANKGEYSWNAVHETFEKTDDSNIISIHFPTEGSATNNAELQLTAFTEVVVYDDIEEDYIYQPEVLKAALFLNNTRQASIDLAIDWDDYGFPLTADISVGITPFTATVSFDVSSATATTLAVSLTREQETVIATNITVNYSDNSKAEDAVKSVNGYVQFHNIKLQGDVNFEAGHTTEVNWNDIVHTALFAGDDKIGDIVFVEEGSTSVAYLQYADGSKEKLETVLQPIFDEVENLKDTVAENS